MPDVQRVCVAVATFRRQRQLAGLLHKLPLQVIDPTKHTLRFLIIDNDVTPTAKAVVDAARQQFSDPLQYIHVPDPGLSVVRNFALRNASENDAFLAMLDDDEVPEPGWLAELLHVQDVTNADAVVGPVSPCLPEGAPRWLKRGRFYEEFMLRDRAALKDGTTANCLLKLSSISRMRLTFDPFFNELGGEDQFFFRELSSRGGTIVFAANAVVRDIIPTERTSLRYLATREFRKGNSLSLCDLRLTPTIQSKLTRLLKSVALFSVSMLSLLPRTCILGGTGAAESVSGAARALGMLAGLGGYRLTAYPRQKSARTG